MTDWLGRDDDTITMLNDLLSGQRTQRMSAGSGPVFGYYGESYPRAEMPFYENGRPVMTQYGGVGTRFPVGNAMGVVSASGERRPDDSIGLYPNVGIAAGPVNIRAGGEYYSEPTGYSHFRPNIGMGVGFPIGTQGGNIAGDVSVTPGYNHSFGAMFNYPIDNVSRISALLRHNRPNVGDPSTQGGFYYTRSF